MDINRIGDYLNIVRVVTNKIGEDRADKGLHTAAVVWTRLVVSPYEDRVRIYRTVP
jgi:hypothetical protein